MSLTVCADPVSKRGLTHADSARHRDNRSRIIHNLPGRLVAKLRREVLFSAGHLQPPLPDGPYWRSAVRKARGSPPGAGRARWVRLEPGWGSLPFAPGAFDVVVASSVLEYVAEPAAVLRECARVLRPGGVVLYTVPDLRHPVRWAEWCAQRLARVTGKLSGDGRRSRWSGYHAYLRVSLQRHCVQWWLAASRQAGLRPVPCQPNGALSPLRLLASRCIDESLANEGSARQ